jgi:hypothetical protein
MWSSKRGNSLLVPAMAMALVLILSGCQKYGQQPARVAGAGKGQSPTDPASKPSEGGYTPEEKTYFVDVTKLKAFEGDVFKKIAGPILVGSIQLKKWLLVPQVLNADDTRNMAVHLLDGEEKALAVQTTQDIRVQKALFEALSEADQGDFLLHEILTSVFLLKNLNDTELCTLIKQNSKASACPFLKMVKDAQEVVGSDETLDSDKNETSDANNQGDIQEAVSRNQANPNLNKTSKPINNPKFGKKEALKPSEYHRIDLMMTYLQTEKDLTAKKISDKMTELGFDTRIFQVQFPG